MRLQTAAIALVSAMLGGVFGVAVWRVVERADPERDDRPAEATVPSVEEQRWWYCLYFGPDESGLNRDTFTTCYRTPKECETMSQNTGCIVSPFAFCGRNAQEPCTLRRPQCEGYPGNAPCERRRP
jgi:hypothetical protein